MITRHENNSVQDIITHFTSAQGALCAYSVTWQKGLRYVFYLMPESIDKNRKIRENLSSNACHMAQRGFVFCGEFFCHDTLRCLIAGMPEDQRVKILFFKALLY